MITENDLLVTQPRIDAAHTIAVLQEKNAPITMIDMNYVYTAGVAHGVDPLGMLAIWWCESRFSSDPESVNIRFTNYNPGNLRNPPPTADIVNTDKGEFLKFASWMEGINALALHIKALYAGLSIHDAINKWAPKSDNNNPDMYIVSLLDFMNTYAYNNDNSGGSTQMVSWVDGSQVTVPTENAIGFPVSVNWLSHYGGLRGLDTISWIILHDTEGSSADSAVSAMNAAGSSAHVVVDRDGSLTVCVPLTVTAYAAGNEPVNQQSINIEQVGYVDVHTGGYTKEQYQSVSRFIRWCAEQGVKVPYTYVGKQDSDNGPLPDVAGILGHMDVPRDDGKTGWGGDYGHTDPGPSYDFNRLIGDIVNGNNGPDGGNGSNGNGTSNLEIAGATFTYTTLTGDSRGFVCTIPGGTEDYGTYIVGHGFFDRWTNNGNTDDVSGLFEKGVGRDGFPLSPEFGMNVGGRTLTIQIFERAVYTWDGEHVDALDTGRLFIQANYALMPREVWK